MSIRASLALLLTSFLIVPTAPPVAAVTTSCDGTSSCLPDLQALPAKDVQLDIKGKNKVLRFSTLSANVGPGPLELKGGAIDSGRSKQEVEQRIYKTSSPTGTPAAAVSVGSFVYHPRHRHFHLENYATYDLVPVNPTGPSNSLHGTKTSFCIQDTLRADDSAAMGQEPPYGTDQGNYAFCGRDIQGMSRGWADRYGYQLAGQSINVSNQPTGTYDLIITINPTGNLLEVSTGNNVSTVRICLTATSVRQGECDSAAG